MHYGIDGKILHALHKHKREVLQTSAFVSLLLFSRSSGAHCSLIKHHYLPNHIKVPLIINHHQNLVWWLYIEKGNIPQDGTGNSKITNNGNETLSSKQFFSPEKSTVWGDNVTDLKDLATESLHDSLGLKISLHTQQEAPHPQPANMSSKQKERSKL